MFFNRTPITMCNFTGCALNSFPSSDNGDWEPLEAQIRPEHAGGAGKSVLGRPNSGGRASGRAEAKEMGSKCLSLGARHDFSGNFAPLTLAKSLGKEA